jgi:hypothetical protein
VAKVALVALVYVAAAKAGLAHAYENSGVTAIWAPPGSRSPRSCSAAGACDPASRSARCSPTRGRAFPAVTLLGITAGNTFEALAGAWLLRAAGLRPDLRRVRDVLGVDYVNAQNRRRALDLKEGTAPER